MHYAYQHILVSSAKEIPKYQFCNEFGLKAIFLVVCMLYLFPHKNWRNLYFFITILELQLLPCLIRFFSFVGLASVHDSFLPVDATADWDEQTISSSLDFYWSSLVLISTSFAFIRGCEFHHINMNMKHIILTHELEFLRLVSGCLVNLVGSLEYLLLHISVLVYTYLIVG